GGRGSAMKKVKDAAITAVRIGAVAMSEDGSGSIVLGWETDGGGGGETTMRYCEGGWHFETETLGKEFVARLFAWMVETAELEEEMALEPTEEQDLAVRMAVQQQLIS